MIWSNSNKRSWASASARPRDSEAVMEYLVGAYAVLWAISFGLVASIVLRQRKIESELKTLRVLVEEETPPEAGQ